MAQLPILYVLVGQHGGPQYSPTVFKSLLSFYHKKADFEIKELVWTELRAKKEAWKTERPTLPTLELPDGKIISDSNNIADWLEEKYPDSSSLFVPEVSSAKAASSGLQTAKGYLNYVTLTFGSPAVTGSQFPPFFAAIHEGIHALSKAEEDREYFRSDTKLGMKDAWSKIQKTNRDESIQSAKGYVKSLEGVFKSSAFLQGDNPGLVDYTLYGRYAFQRVADPSAAKQIWKSQDTPNVAKWIESIESKYAEEMKDQKSRWPAEE